MCSKPNMRRRNMQRWPSRRRRRRGCIGALICAIANGGSTAGGRCTGGRRCSRRNFGSGRSPSFRYARCRRCTGIANQSLLFVLSLLQLLSRGCSAHLQLVPQDCLLAKGHGVSNDCATRRLHCWNRYRSDAAGDSRQASAVAAERAPGVSRSSRNRWRGSRSDRRIGGMMWLR